MWQLGVCVWFGGGILKSETKDGFPVFTLSPKKPLSFEPPHLKLLGQLAKNDDARSVTHFGGFKRRGRKGDPFRDRGDDHTHWKLKRSFYGSTSFAGVKIDVVSRMSKTLF